MELVGDNSKLVLEIIGKSYPNSMNEWDRRWLTVNVIINLIGFNGKNNNYEKTK